MRPLPRRDFLQLSGRALAGAAVGAGVGTALLTLPGCNGRTAEIPPGTRLAPAALRSLQRVDERVVAGGSGDDAPRIRAAIERAARLVGGPGARAVVQLEGELRMASPVVVLPGIILRGGTIRRTGDFGYVSLKSDSTLLGVHLVDEGRWDPGSLDQHVKQPAISAGSNAESPPNNGWAVLDCTIESFHGYGINTGQFGGLGVIEGNRILGNANAGVQLIHNSPGCTVRGNEIRGNGYNGIDCNASDSLLEGNTCVGNGLARTRFTTDLNGILVVGLGHDVLNVDIRDNVCRDNARHGIHLGGTGGNCWHIRILDNECDHNAMVGILIQGGRSGSAPAEGEFVYATSDVEVGRNHCRDNGISGIQRGANEFTFVQNCRLYENVATGNAIRDISVCPGVDPDAEPFDFRLVGDTNVYGTGVC